VRKGRTGTGRSERREQAKVEQKERTQKVEKTGRREQVMVEQKLENR
jgi:hypothetical protein